jgi:hypothetical protein
MCNDLPGAYIAEVIGARELVVSRLWPIKLMDNHMCIESYRMSTY